MFKTTWSILPTSWISAKKTEDVTAKAPIPTSTIFRDPNTKSTLYNISMNEQSVDDDDSFIDITTRKLSYAEVAALSQNKKQTNRLSKPKENRVNTNQYEVLAKNLKDDDDLDEMEEPIEKFKSNHYFKKNKQYKQSDRLKSKKK